TTGSERTVSERVRQFLVDEERLLSHISPSYLLEKAIGQKGPGKFLHEVYELCLKSPGLAIPEKKDVLIEAITEGLKSGLMG
ncbi:MAG: hypothetical protein N2234_09320, partial [Planctomycetota bacterium]|nr:hypothetical protein [Planctomycetota bacterium]